LKKSLLTNPSCHASGVTPPKMKMALIDSKAYFRIKPPCPAFWGVAPRTMKKGRRLGLYFRTKPPCPAFWGVAPPKMKIERDQRATSNSIFELNNPDAGLKFIPEIRPDWFDLL
jgi:hypothetical protein